MKNFFNVFGLMFLFVTMASFTFQESSSSSVLEVGPPIIQGYEAVKNGTTIYFNTQQCAIDNGYTLTGNVAMLPETQVYKCFQ
ncbi:hypothetical protein LXD69_09330 [Flavobacterium sediminilitoris]|uniref:Uncharacterized protein n=1 Tax=Flavobacterium sediminilitoris TaxID=2024526 RepID=A0ABY4HI89_9FLAO|nr:MULTISPECIES: hypothetical protein [Flavobacterium]UOX32255.1 hypothetical protein LXD69_09330 [Flavobacterium sediminilitoris]